jgi:hypothetical protein
MEYRPKSRGKDKRCTSEAKVNTSEIASEADIEHLLHIPEIFVVPPTDELRPASAWTQFPVGE